MTNAKKQIERLQNLINRANESIERIEGEDKEVIGWQPIETAPEDCEVLIYYESVSGKGMIVISSYVEELKDWYNKNETYYFGEYRFPITGYITHWMPLPKSPKQ